VKVLVYVHTETQEVEKPRNLCFLFRPFGNKSIFVWGAADLFKRTFR